jgi:hypothetical protein
MISQVIKSDRKGKKYKAILTDGKEIHFGSDVSETYLDHKDKKKRENYLKRHLANPVERHHVENMVMSPALLSAYLLWNTPSLEKNIEVLNKELKKK